MTFSRHNQLTFVDTVDTKFPSSDYSHGWIPLLWFAEEYIRTKVTSMNTSYSLMSILLGVVTFFSVTLPQANIGYIKK